MLDQRLRKAEETSASEAVNRSAHAEPIESATSAMPEKVEQDQCWAPQSTSGLSAQKIASPASKDREMIETADAREGM